MTTEVVFPRAVAQMVANVINNTFFSMDLTNRVQVVSPFTLKFDRPIQETEVAIVDQQLDQHGGSYMHQRRT